MRKWRWVAGGGVVVVVALACAGGWWLVRKPAPAPPGMAARLEAEQRAFIESLWPEGEAAWPLLARAIAAEGEEKIDLAIEASERARLYESLDALPGATTPFSAAPFPSIEVRALTRDVGYAARQAMVDGDTERAAATIRAALRLLALQLQQTGLMTAMLGASGATLTFELIADALRQADVPVEVCDAVIAEIRAAGFSAALVAAPTVAGAEHEEQSTALVMRIAMRDTSVIERLRVQLRSFQSRPAGYDPMDYFIDDWLLWTLRYDAPGLERMIDGHHEALQAWWMTPALERPKQPEYPGGTAEALWLVSPRIWPSVRTRIDELAMREAGVILLLRIEAHHARAGAWPATLDEAAPPEEIIDPVTGRAFVYELVADPAPDEWPFTLRAPMTLEEFDRIILLDERSRYIEDLWRRTVTITIGADEVDD